MTPFRWKNCYADVQTAKHDATIKAYLNDVILPALTVLDKRIEELGRNDDSFAPFVQSDTQVVLQETKMAFALSVQSIWERQIRAYLIGCAKELRPGEDIETDVEKSDWKKLRKLFFKLRGIKLEEFPSFRYLDTLHHLGNACRHGDGKSALELFKRHPDLWQSVPPLPLGFGPSNAGQPKVGTMNISVKHLRSFVHAIAEFWHDTTYIYNESINLKHAGLEARLTKERMLRKWVPQSQSEVN